MILEQQGKTINHKKRAHSEDIFTKYKQKSLEKLKSNAPNNDLLIRVNSDKKIVVGETKTRSNSQKLEFPLKFRKEKVEPNRKLLKIERPSTLVKHIPSQGFTQVAGIPYFNGINVKKHIMFPTISKEGAIIVSQKKLQFMKTEEYEKMYKKIMKLKNIQFFKNFKHVKFFHLWKNSLKKNVYNQTKRKLQFLYKLCFFNEQLSIACYLHQIVKCQWQGIINESLQFKQYTEALKKACKDTLQPFTSKLYLKLIKIVMNESQLYNHQSTQLIESHYRNKKQQICLKVLLRKSLYMFQDTKIQVLTNLLRDYSKRIDQATKLYDIHYNQTYFNHFISGITIPYQLPSKNYEYRIGQIILKVNMVQQSIHLSTSLQKIREFFVQFVDFSIQQLCKKNKTHILPEKYLNFVMFVEESIDVNNLINTIIQKEPLFLQIKKNIEELICKNIVEVEKIIENLNKIFKKNQFLLDSGQTKYYFSLVQLFNKTINAQKQINLLPKSISIGLFWLDLDLVLSEQLFKLSEFLKKINQILIFEIDSSAEKIERQTKFYNNKIHTRVQKLKQLILAVKVKDEYQKKLKEQSLLNQMYKNILVIKVYLPHLYVSYNFKYLKCKTLIQDVQKNIQLFNQKIPKMLIKFSNQIVEFKQQIKFEVQRIEYQMLSLSNQPFQVVLRTIPLMNQKIAHTTLKIQQFLYVQDLQFTNFLITQKQQQFSTLLKVKQVLKNIFSCIQKYQKYQSFAQEQYPIQLNNILLTDQLSNLLNNGLLEIKQKQKTVNNFVPFFTYLHKYYQDQKNLIYTIKLLKCLNYNEVLQIQPFEKYKQEKKMINFEQIKSLQIHLKYQQIQKIIMTNNFRGKSQDLMEKKQYIQTLCYFQVYRAKIEEFDYPLFRQIKEMIVRYDDLLVYSKKIVSESCVQFHQELADLAFQIEAFLILLQELEEIQEDYIKLMKLMKGRNEIINLNGIKINIPKINVLWLSIINSFRQKYICHVAFEFDESGKMIQEFQQCYHQQFNKIKKIQQNYKKQFSLLYLLSEEIIISVIQNPLIFYFQFYPFIQNIEQRNQKSVIVIYTGEQIVIEHIQDQKLQNSYLNLKRQLLNIHKQFSNKYKFQNFITWKQQNIPLVFVYTCDQFYLQSLSRNKTKMDQHLSKQIQFIRDSSKSVKNVFNKYFFNLIEILIMSRLEFRQRLSNININQISQNWISYESINDKVGITIFDRFIPFEYNLSDSKKISFFHHQNEKVLIKIYSMVVKNEWGIISETSNLTNIFAKLCYHSIFIFYKFENIQNILIGVSNSHNDLVVVLEGVSQQQQIQLLMSFLSLIQIQISEKRNLLDLQRRKNPFKIIPKLFIYSPQFNIKEMNIDKKINLRYIQYVSPKIDLLIQLFSLKSSCVIKPNTQSFASMILKKYCHIMRNQYNYEINQELLKKIIQNLVRSISSTKQRDNKSNIIRYFSKILSQPNFQRLLTQNKKKLIMKFFNGCLQQLQSSDSEDNMVQDKIKNLMKNFSLAIKCKKPITLLGRLGTGKTSLYKQFISKQDDQIQTFIISLNLIEKQFELKPFILQSFITLSPKSSNYIIFQGFEERVYKTITCQEKRKEEIKIIFEVEKFQKISPNLIVQLFFINLTQQSITWQNIVQKEEIQINKEFKTSNINSQCFKFMRQILIKFQKQFMIFKWLVKVKIKDIVKNSFILFKSFVKLKKPFLNNLVINNNQLIFYKIINKLFIYCFQWVCTLNLNKTQKKKLSKFLSEEIKQHKQYEEILSQSLIDVKKNGIFYHSIRNFSYSQIQAKKFSANNKFFVETSDSITLKYFLQILKQTNHSVILYGKKGIGKSTVMKNYFNESNDLNLITSVKTYQQIQIKFLLKLKNLNIQQIKTNSLKDRKLIKNNILVLIEDISFQERQTLKYNLHFLRQHNKIKVDKHFEHIGNCKVYLERFTQSESQYLEYWRNFFLINYSPSQQNFYEIFKTKIQSIFHNYSNRSLIEKLKKKTFILSKFYCDTITEAAQKFNNSPLNSINKFSFKLLFNIIKNFTNQNCFKSEQQIYGALFKSFYWNCVSRFKIKQQNEKTQFIQMIKAKEQFYYLKGNFSHTNDINKMNQFCKIKQTNNKFKINELMCQNLALNIIKLKQNMISQNIIIANFQQMHNYSFTELAFHYLGSPLIKIQNVQNQIAFHQQIKNNINPFSETNYFLIPPSTLLNNNIPKYITKYFQDNEFLQNQQIDIKKTKIKFLIEYHPQMLARTGLLEQKQIMDGGFVWFEKITFQSIHQYIKKLIIKNFQNQELMFETISQKIQDLLKILQDICKSIPQLQVRVLSVKNAETFCKTFIHLYNEKSFALAEQKSILDLGIKHIKKIFDVYDKRKKQEQTANSELINLQKTLEQKRCKYNQINKKIENFILRNDNSEVAQLQNELMSYEQQLEKITTKQKILYHNYKQYQLQIHRNVIDRLYHQDIAQLKSLYLNSCQSYKSYFEALVLCIEGSQDPIIIKKTIYDVNLMSRIKEANILNLNLEIINSIRQKVNSVGEEEDKNLSSKSIVNWLKFGSQLCFIRSNLAKNIKECQYKINNTKKQINKTLSMKDSLDQLQEQLQRQKNTIQYIQSEISRLYHQQQQIALFLSDLANIQNIQVFYLYCSQKNTQIEIQQSLILPKLFENSIIINYTHFLDENIIIDIKNRLKSCFQAKYFDKWSLEMQEWFQRKWLFKQKCILSVEKIQILRMINFYASRPVIFPLLVVSKDFYLLEVIDSSDCLVLRQQQITESTKMFELQQKQVIIILLKNQDNFTVEEMKRDDSDEYEIIIMVGWKNIKISSKIGVIFVKDSYQDKKRQQKFHIIKFQKDQKESAYFLKHKFTQILYKSKGYYLQNTINHQIQKRQIFVTAIQIILSFNLTKKRTSFKHNEQGIAIATKKWRKLLNQFHTNVEFMKSIQKEFQHILSRQWSIIEIAIETSKKTPMKANVDDESLINLMKLPSESLSVQERGKSGCNYILTFLLKLSFNIQAFTQCFQQLSQKNYNLKDQIIRFLSTNHNLRLVILNIYKNSKRNSFQIHQLFKFQNQNKVQQLITNFKQKPQLKLSNQKHNHLDDNHIFIKPTQCNQENEFIIQSVNQFSIYDKFPFEQILKNNVLYCSCNIFVWLNINPLRQYPNINSLKNAVHLKQPLSEEEVLILISNKQSLTFTNDLQKVIQKRKNKLIILSNTIPSKKYSQIIFCSIDLVIDFINQSKILSKNIINKSEDQFMKIYKNFYLKTTLSETSNQVDEIRYCRALNDYLGSNKKKEINQLFIHMQIQWGIWRRLIFQPTNIKNFLYSIQNNQIQNLLTIQKNIIIEDDGGKSINKSLLTHQIQGICKDKMKIFEEYIRRCTLRIQCYIGIEWLEQSFKMLMKTLKKIKDKEQVYSGMNGKIFKKFESSQMLDQKTQLQQFLIRIANKIINFISTFIKLSVINLQQLNQNYFYFSFISQNVFCLSNDVPISSTKQIQNHQPKQSISLHFYGKQIQIVQEFNSKLIFTYLTFKLNSYIQIKFAIYSERGLEQFLDIMKKTGKKIND